MTTTRPTNTDDVIDSRDVIQAIEELESDGTMDEGLAVELAAILTILYLRRREGGGIDDHDTTDV